MVASIPAFVFLAVLSVLMGYVPMPTLHDVPLILVALLGIGLHHERS